jgi:hypothetical protein
MTPSTPRKRTYRNRRSWPWFTAFGIFTVLGLFVVPGAIGGVVLFAAAAVLLVGCVMALAGEDTRTVERTGFMGGGGF